ncbi:MAG: DUF4388 domain-containing protein [Acidobacteria bacterium]|nr:DUF4388 domain-containing protein [Acidobacteriota bacterium]
MALTGQLSDMSLAELIEFFCNQRKTGRLKIDYQRGHSVFFIKEGELVDAKVGALSGAEAVYFSLTLPNAAFDFSPDVLPTRQTIKESWTQVVLEGLRRLDEGVSPTEAEAFGGWTPSESDMAIFMDQVDRLGGGTADEASKEKADGKAPVESEAPFSMMVDGVNGDNGGSRKKWMVMGTVAGVALICAAAAIPLSGAFSSKPAATPAAAVATYDEQGRVTQASVAGASPGAEAYGGTAVRAARGKHFPAGKAGSTVVTIPVN